MKRLSILIAILLTINAFGVDMSRVSIDRERTPPTMGYVPQAAPNASVNTYQSFYNPNYYDQNYNNLMNEYTNEDIFQLKLKRCVFQYVNMMMQITTGILFIGSQCCMDNYMDAARILNGLGLSLGMTSFMLSILLLKLDNKIEDIDTYRLQNAIYPDVVPR